MCIRDRAKEGMFTQSTSNEDEMSHGSANEFLENGEHTTSNITENHSVRPFNSRESVNLGSGKYS